MASGDGFQGLVLTGITKLDRKELGRGAYGRVYTVDYHGTICAAKEIHSILVEEVGEVEMRRTVESFMRECRQCSTLRHPNVIQFLGVHYPFTEAGGVQRRMRLPVMVMEMMADSLTSLVDKHEKIPVHIKFSIVHDVSLGLCYFHNHDPPIVHRDLSPNNILLTAHHVAKISDLGVAKVIRPDSRKTMMTKAPGTVDFMPPESLANVPVYGTPMDVFSFAGIILHTFNQEWPRPTELVQYDHKTRKMAALSEVERRQQYLDKLRGEAEVLRPLVEECLDYDPAVRPTMAAVCERIQVIKDGMKESPQDVITLCQEVEQKDIEIEQFRSDNEQLISEIEQLKSENEQLTSEKDQLKSEIDQFKSENEQLISEDDQLKSEIGQLKSENKTLKQQLFSTRSVPTQQVADQLDQVNLEEPITKTSKLKIEAPPLAPTLTSGKYQLKWTRLADLPAPMYIAATVVQDKKVYVCGGVSPVDDTYPQVYVYDINTDQWGHLPPPGHCYCVPQIIGGKLTIIGGRLSATWKLTNKVLTFDGTSQTWGSHYPDLLSVRGRPGVVTHMEHVIVAGGVAGDDMPVAQDDIEVLNWLENSHWRRVSVNLPEPMDIFTPFITDDYYCIVGYDGVDSKTYNNAYKIPVVDITRSHDQKQASDTPTKWIIMTPVDHWHTTSVSSLSLPVVVGGEDQGGMPTSDIKMYDNSSESWRNIASLSSARSLITVVAINNNAIIVIGGCTRGGRSALSYALTTVELGQVNF